VVRSLYRETVDRHRAPGYAEARRVRAAQFDRIADDLQQDYAGRSDQPLTAPGETDMYAGAALAHD
jgi:hypothetical protein